MNFEDLQEHLAKTILDWHESIRQVLKDLPDEDLPALSEECRRLSQPMADRTFPMPVWDLVAHVVDTEHMTRETFKKAAAHMEATGERFYCVHCQGSCTPEHLAEFADDT